MIKPSLKWISAILFAPELFIFAESNLFGEYAFDAEADGIILILYVVALLLLGVALILKAIQKKGYKCVWKQANLRVFWIVDAALQAAAALTAIIIASGYDYGSFFESFFLVGR